MTESVDYQAVLADLKARRARLDDLIARLEIEVTGQAADGTTQPHVSPPPASPITAIHPDTFYGLGIAEAAKKYLKMARRAQHTSAIADALERGGLKRPQENNVFSILVRAAKGREVVKVGKGLWGLAEFYPKPAKEPTDGARKPKVRTAKLRVTAKPRVGRPKGKRILSLKPAPTEKTTDASPSAIMLDVVRLAGKPLHVRDIAAQLHARGGTSTAATVAGMFARWAQQGKVKKTGPNMYAV